MRPPFVIFAFLCLVAAVGILAASMGSGLVPGSFSLWALPFLAAAAVFTWIARGGGGPKGPR